MNSTHQVACAQVSLSGEIESFSDIFAQQLGCAKEDLKGRKLFDFLAQHDDDPWGIEWCNEKAEWFGELSYKRPSGKIAWMSEHRRVEHNPDGTPACVIISQREITRYVIRYGEHKRLSQLLSETETTAGVGAWEVDLQNYTLWWSPVTRAIHEVPDDYVPDMRTAIEFYKAGSSRDAVIKAVEKAMATGEGFDFEVELITGKGNSIWVRSIGKSEIINGRCVRLFGTFQSIEKERMIRRELRLKTDRAMEANEAKSRFLANMSHEVRTPMNAIIGMSHLLVESEELKGDLREWAEIICQNAESMMRLINSILDFSKIEAGSLNMEQLPFDVRDLFQTLVSSFYPSATNKGISLSCDIAPSVPRCLVGDAGWILQVLNSLVDNAIKFTSEGSVAISVHATDKIDETVNVHFSVKDTGIGISEADRNQIFERFTQIDDSMTRNYGGVGLGLAIARDLVHQMGSEITLLSEVGSGTEIRFVLKLGTDSAKVLNPTNNDIVAGARILIADDDPQLRDVMSGTLQQWGACPITAEDGVRALQILYEGLASEQPIKAVIIDYLMPNMDGVTLARAIKADKRLAETRLILLSAMTNLERLSLNAKGLFDDKISKPVNASTLLDSVAGLLDARFHSDKAHYQERLDRLKNKAARVLVVEDNEVNQIVVSSILEEFGIPSDCVYDGSESIEGLKSIQYDLILMDIQMPVMNGLEATRAIRAMEATEYKRPIPIIALTAHARDEDRQQCLDAGMNDYITKPIDRTELARVLDEWLAAPLPLRAMSAKDISSGLDEFLIFDDTELATRYVNRADMIERIFMRARTSLQQTFSQFEVAVRARDAKVARFQIHSGKGAASSLGCCRLGELSRRVEVCLEENEDFTITESALPLLQSELESALKAIDQVLAKRK